MAGKEYADKIGLSMQKGWKKDEYRRKFFDIGPKEEQILVDHAKIVTPRSRKKPST